MTEIEGSSRLISVLRAENERVMILQAEIERLMDGMEAAWGLIANAQSVAGDGKVEHWQESMERWRDNDWHPALKRNDHPEFLKTTTASPLTISDAARADLDSDYDRREDRERELLEQIRKDDYEAGRGP